MTKQILEDYKIKYNIDKVLNLLVSKGETVIDDFSSNMTNITNFNIDVPVEENSLCDMRILQIFDSEHAISTELTDFFANEIFILSKIPNLKRAMYIFVSPNSVIPKHADDDDPYFRIIFGVNTPSKKINDVGLVVEDCEIQLNYGDVIGVKSDVVHWGWNNTNKYWTVLTLCVEDKKLDELRKVY